ncbi:uncharacterized protein Dwil_GK19381 [Drosophila willistoni]|uniref:Uncharacterized protein n=2 Tax=Drosophila willistoni TaxID=7260 RepID=B4MSY6_DROWI|nr:uncharacterized protein Dwil_GK19381 [Drosophila willistoni]
MDKKRTLRMMRALFMVIYNDRFCWNVVKSYGMFFAAVGLSKSLQGFELIPTTGFELLPGTGF